MQQVAKVQFYTELGLKALGHLVEYTECCLGVSQNQLAKIAGVNSMTLGRIKQNISYPGVAKPDPEIVLQIAATLVNPENRHNFDPEDLLEIARGKRTIKFIRGDRMSLRDFAALISRGFVAWVRERGLEGYSQERQLFEFSETTGISVPRLKQIMSPTNSMPIASDEIILLSQVVPSPSGKLLDVDGLNKVIEKQP